MIIIREAVATDAAGIREIFLSCYGTDYAYPQFYDIEQLTKIIHSDATFVLVAEDDETGLLAGTASVVTEVGAYSDMVGEFGRLAVHVDFRERGIGGLLMEERLKRVRERLHVGLIDARVLHPYTLKIAEAHAFSVVGFLPLKMLLSFRESIALMAQHFGESLALRRNHPRIIPEIHALAHQSMTNCSLEFDAIVDEESAPYPHCQDFELQELTTEGYTPLLRIERGRVRNREIFGPMRLHYGFFKLQACHASYLVARDEGRIVGAIGFTVDKVEKAVRIFELISSEDNVIRFLLSALDSMCREKLDVAYVEVDVSAYAPRMQRTLLELNFLPAAYIPALAFHEVERLDVVKMVSLMVPLELGTIVLSPTAQKIADIVLKGFTNRTILPRIAKAVETLKLFEGLSEEQVLRVASVCSLATFEGEQTIFNEGDLDRSMHVILDGVVSITVKGFEQSVGTVGSGECLGEMSLLTASPHSATARAQTNVETAVLLHTDLAGLFRQRPDIGLVMYKNLAVGLGSKLLRSDLSLVQGTTISQKSLIR